METDFNTLISTFQPTIFSRGFYCDFKKIREKAFTVKVQLSILNSLL